jgi:hypothetical protein
MISLSRLSCRSRSFPRSVALRYVPSISRVRRRSLWRCQHRRSLFMPTFGDSLGILYSSRRPASGALQMQSDIFPSPPDHEAELTGRGSPRAMKTPSAKVAAVVIVVVVGGAGMRVARRSRASIEIHLTCRSLHMPEDQRVYWRRDRRRCGLACHPDQDFVGSQLSYSNVYLGRFQCEFQTQSKHFPSILGRDV